MNRTRYPPRKAQIGRNPSNLTVIPTELPIVSPTLTIITVPVNDAAVPPKNPVVPKKPAGNDYNTKRKRFRNRGRKRRRGRGAQYPTAEVPSDNFRWVNKNNVNQVDKSGNKSPVKEENIKKTSQNVKNIAENDSMEVTSENEKDTTENVKDVEIVDLEHEENVTETPAEDNCFEEVEVASSEGEEKQVLVGFRKTKLYYLNYKKKLFFKPKIYELSSERTTVNCLNASTGDSATADVDIDVDVVSEAEYEYEGDNVDQGDSEDMFGKILEIEEEPVNEDADQKDEDNSIEIIDDIVVSESAEPAPKRNYKTCFEGEENGFFQGKSFIQDNLDSWKSHLIGLEYLIEILSKSKDSVENYHCVLCECDLQVQGFPEVCVLNHVSGREHVIKYLDKHFPAFNSSFSEKSELNFFTLQKFCELINEKLGHYFMCITNLDYYSVNKKKIKEVIQDASHPCETNMDFDKSNFLKKIDCDLTGELNSVLCDIIEKILNKDAKSVENGLLKDIASKSEQISKTGTKVAPIKNKNSEIGKSSVKDPFKSVDKQSKSSKPSLPKYKDNSAVASFLRLGFAATTKFGQPSSKKPPGKIGAVSDKKNKSEVGKKSPAVEKKSPEVEKKSPEVEKKSSEDVKRDQEENDLSKDLLGGDKVNSLGGSKNNLKKAISKGATKNLKADPKSDVSEEIELIVIEDNADEVLPTEKTPSNITEVSASEKFPKKKGKMIFKPTMHSKHCSKRILDSKLRTSTKASGKKQLIPSVSNKPKNLPGTKIIVSKSEKEVIAEKITEDNKQIKVISGGSHKKIHSHKTNCLHAVKSSALDSAVKHSSLHHKNAYKNTIENLSKDNSNVSVTDTLSQWIPMTDLSSSVVNPPASDMSHLFNPNASVRRHSKSPVGRIISPLRLVVGNYSSAHRKRSRSPARQKSRSPVRRLSRSPLRKGSRSPHRRHSRSPVRRHSRSPHRRQSRSPLRRRSRSPLRRRSRSPLRKRSRSPLRKRSRSPLRRRSRSPLRKHSRSPLRRHSRSPLRRLSRSPLRRLSRSPLRRLSRSPLRRHSRSPFRRHSRSPARRHPRSPLGRHSRSPLRKFSRSPAKGYLGSSIRKPSISPIHSESSMYRNPHKVHSPLHRHSSGSRDRQSPNVQFSNKDYDFHKYVDSLESELAKMKSKSEMLSSSRNKKSDQFKSSSFSSSSLRGISDLDPVSDEDESVYFGDKRSEDSKTSSSSKMLLSKLLQKFSMSDANLNDPALNKLMQFMDVHSNEIEEFIGTQSTSKPSRINETKIDPLVHERTLLLQQFLSNVALQQGLSSFTGLHNIPKFMQTPLQDNYVPGFGLPPQVSNMQTLPNPNMQQPLPNPNMQQPLPAPIMQQPPPTLNMQQPPPLTPNMQPPQHVIPQPPVQPTVFPPNVNVPPPHPNVNMPPPQFYNQPTSFNQPRPDFSLKRKVAPEVMFKDLKATVNKLFGANEGNRDRKQEKSKLQMPTYVTEPDPEKWDLNRSDVSKYNAPGGSKNVSPLGKNANFSGMSDRPNMREEVSLYNRNNKNARNTSEQLYCESIDRPRIPNVPVPPPDAKVSFCDMPSSSSKGNLFPVVNNPRGNTNYNSSSRGGGVSDVKVSLAQRLASVLVKVGMIDVPAPLLQEMLMKIGAFSSSPRQDISESEILTILKRLGYL